MNVFFSSIIENPSLRVFNKNGTKFWIFFIQRLARLAFHGMTQSWRMYGKGFVAYAVIAVLILYCTGKASKIIPFGLL